jgi:NADH-quinone oxidoreductase subunit L
MHHEQDMRRMGGLKKYMPYTCWTFVISWLAIAGVPPFSGFFSKDEILTYTFQQNKILYAVGLFTALLTAYYMSRVTFRTFFGKEHWTTYANAGEHEAVVAATAELDGLTDAQIEAAKQAEASVLVGSASGAGYALDVDAVAYPDPPHNDHIGPDFKPHESVWTMTVPLVILAFFAATAGFLNVPFPSSAHFLEKWLEPVFEANSTHLHLSNANIVVLLVVSTIVALLGIGIAAAAWLKHSFDPRIIEPKLFAWAYYYDWAVGKFAGGPGREGFSATAKFDAVAIDGAVNGVGRLSRLAGILLHHLQNGYVRLYALMITIGAVALIAYMFSRIVGLGA